MYNANSNITKEEFNEFVAGFRASMAAMQADMASNLRAGADMATKLESVRADISTMQVGMATKKDMESVDIKLGAMRAEMTSMKTDMATKLESVRADMVTMKSDMATKEDLEAMQRRMDAFEFSPMPYGRPQAFHSEARVHSVSGSRLTRTGRF